MTIAAQSTILRCVLALQDPTSVRWPVAELVRYLNDGQREIILHRPDASSTTATLALATGSKQALPSGGSKLISVIRNTSGNKRAIRLVPRTIMDAQTPGWHNVTGSAEILHYIYDEREPRTFYVYPPASSASVESTYSVFPTDIAEPAEGALYTAVSGNLSVPDIYANALQDYILYRSYAKDAEYTANAGRVQAHFAAFANALGSEIKATIAVSPKADSETNRSAGGGA